VSPKIIQIWTYLNPSNKNSSYKYQYYLCGTFGAFASFRNHFITPELLNALFKFETAEF